MDCFIDAIDAKHQLTESVIHTLRLPEKIGDKWKDLARKLGYIESVVNAIQTEENNIPKECCITVLVRWMEREAEGATVERLAQVLTEIELKNLSRLLKDYALGGEVDVVGSDDRGQGSKVKAKMKELEEKLAVMTQEKQTFEERCQKLQEVNSELVKELRDVKQQIQAGSSKQDVKTGLDSPREEESENTRDETTEQGIVVQLRLLNEQLIERVISPLQVSEVKEDKLKTSVMIDLLIRLSMTLQELYSTTLSMVTKSCKCSEDVKREFYDFAYHGLRAEHNDLIHRVEELTSVEKEMTGEEQSELSKLRELQSNRQRLVNRLENLWRGLFSPYESRPKVTCSEPYGASGCSADSEKNLQRYHSYPREQNTSTTAATTSDDETHEGFQGDKVEEPFQKNRKST
ncbi:hypothetical protein pdam_00015297 [Pocillopora damicornis]|uniref:Death domain-containing protein n=1 Tax=Pocillopora damicornis TaxID=46731 RepID=A0A3M6TP87_POCDA|nr:hypothetical protein pdam_00015297 [Pocillopora damicornis]